MLNTGSNIRTSTVLKGPHPELGISGGRKPGANASATGASAPKTVAPLAQINTHTRKGGLPTRLCALMLEATLPPLRLNG